MPGYRIAEVVQLSTEGQPVPGSEIFRAYDAGRAALLVTGRSLYDWVPVGNRIHTLLEYLRRRAREEHGMATISYSLASGLDWDAERMRDGRDRETIEKVLGTHQLLGIEQDRNEVVKVLRGISSLARARSGAVNWSDGGPMRFLFLLEFSEHLTPRLDEGHPAEQESVAVELAHILGQSNALRESGNLVVFHGQDGRIDDLVTSALHPIRLSQPGELEKRQFLTVARGIYPGARFEDDISDRDVERLTSNTPNRGLEEVLLASDKTGMTIQVEELVRQKSRDVESLTEHTLTVLDSRRVADLELVGTNIERPAALLVRFGEGLLHGDPHMPSNVILVGPPGVGKTDLALLAAREARASAYQIHSPKGGIVGETERKVRLQTTAMREWTPHVAFIDEITEALPLERTDFDGDSGATRSVTAALLTTLSDESRRGRSLLIATTNCPWRMGAAMRSRFTMIPVLTPLMSDYPDLIRSLADRITPECSHELAEDAVREAGEVFFRKGASPREILAALRDIMLDAGEMTDSTVVRAAVDLCSSPDRVSTVYADLWAIRACPNKRYYPWHERETDYPYPEHLQGLVDPAGELDVRELDKRIEELKPRANV